jgi:flagellar hook capping protein FlgD
VPADLHVGVAAAKVKLNPGMLNQTSQGQYVDTRVWSPQGTDAHLIVTESLRLQRVLPPSPIDPLYVEDTTVPPDSWRWSAYYKFSRAELLGLLPEALKVPVEVIGRLADETWFQAWDTVRVQRPRVAHAGAGASQPNDPMPSLVQSASYVPLRLYDPEGAPASTFELWYSPDAGQTWSAVEQNITAHEYSWTVPEEATEQALLGIVAFDELGFMGSRVTNVFEIINGTTDVRNGDVPDRLAIRFSARNPGPQAVMEFGMPLAGEASVRVYDVKGALVRELANGPFDPGWHRVTWDGAGASGAVAQPGVYFVKGHANGQQVNQRFVLLK